jgi:RNA polymerase sigma-70 factor (ECF subfamily)
VASSLARSGERKQIEEKWVAEALQEHVDRWQQKQNWVKLKCIELLIVRGWSNKKVAANLAISEQQVANFKFDFLASMKAAIRTFNVDTEVIAELHGD